MLNAHHSAMPSELPSTCLFIFSCKANYPFKTHILSHLKKAKGSQAWMSMKKLIAVSWMDKKAFNTFSPTPLKGCNHHLDNSRMGNLYPTTLQPTTARSAMSIKSIAIICAIASSTRQSSTLTHSALHHLVPGIRQCVAHLSARQQAAAQQEEGLVLCILSWPDGASIALWASWGPPPPALPFAIWLLDT